MDSAFWELASGAQIFVCIFYFLYGVKQGSQFHLEGGGDYRKRTESRILFAAFNGSDVGSVQPTPASKLLLGPASALSDLTDVRPKRLLH
jgi:hypothetical protein